MDEEYFVPAVRQLRTVLIAVLPPYIFKKTPVVHAGCLYLLSRLTNSPPSITDIIEYFPLVTARHLLTIKQYTQRSEEYRSFRRQLVQPIPAPLSRMTVLATRIGLSPEQVAIVDMLHVSIHRSGVLSNRPSTIDGVALLRFRHVHHAALCLNTIELLVGRKIATIRKAYNQMYTD
jgi:hypothetical protein